MVSTSLILAINWITQSTFNIGLSMTDQSRAQMQVHKLDNAIQKQRNSVQRGKERMIPFICVSGTRNPDEASEMPALFEENILGHRSKTPNLSGKSAMDGCKTDGKMRGKDVQSVHTL